MPLQLERLSFPSPPRGVRCAFLGKARFTEQEAGLLGQSRFSEGWEECQKNLRAQLMQQRSDLMELQNGIFKSLRSAAGEVIKQTEEMIIELVAVYVRKITGEASMSGEAIRQITTEALANVSRETLLRVRIHPEDFRLLREFNEQQPGSSEDGLELVPDTTLARGDCVVETRFGMVDARRETKLAAMERHLGVG